MGVGSIQAGLPGSHRELTFENLSTVPGFPTKEGRGFRPFPVHAVGAAFERRRCLLVAGGIERHVGLGDPFLGDNLAAFHVCHKGPELILPGVELCHLVVGAFADALG